MSPGGGQKVRKTVRQSESELEKSSRGILMYWRPANSVTEDQLAIAYLNKLKKEQVLKGPNLTNGVLRVGDDVEVKDNVLTRLENCQAQGGFCSASLFC